MTKHSPFPSDGREIRKQFTAHVCVNMSRKMCDAVTVAADRHGMTHGQFLRLVVVWALDTNPSPPSNIEEAWIDNPRETKSHQAQFHVAPITRELLDKLAAYHQVTRAQLVRIIVSRYLSANAVTKPLRAGDHTTGGRPDTAGGR